MLIILEYCGASSLLQREQFYINTIQPAYNILPVAGSSEGSKWSEEALENGREQGILCFPVEPVHYLVDLRSIAS